jgi:hypothetical protein
MPQLSLYIDEEILKKIEIAAKMNNISISKFVSDTMKTHLSNGWTKGFENVFGSITDESFEINDFKDFSSDTERESI